MKDMKYDKGKVRMELLPFDCLTEMAKVLTFGAEKYKDNSWQTVKNSYERYRGSLLRHMAAMQAGEILDKESGLPHAAHLATNAMFILWFELHKEANACRSARGRLKARLDKLNGVIANIPKERLEEICELYDLFINKKCYKYFAISNTENGKEIDEVIFKDIKIDGERTCIIGYPEKGGHGYWHTLKDMGIKCFVGENAKERAEERLKELKGK